MKIHLLKANLYALLCAFLLAMNTPLSGQSNPVPFILESGPYEFTTWDSSSVAGTYPPNMIFHYVTANQTTPFYTDGTLDYNCPYNKTKRPRINGLVGDGISFTTTSSSQYNDCTSGTADSRFIGAALVSLDVTARMHVMVSWKSETVIPGDGNGDPSNARIWKIRQQYRIGATGLFTDVPGPVEFVSSIASGDSVTFGPVVLPGECDNQPLVQVRWIYFESSAGVGGSRPSLRLDDIQISGVICIGIDEQQVSNDRIFEIFPNPATSQFSIRTESIRQGTIRVIDLVGKEVIQTTFSNTLTNINSANLPSGVYFVQVFDESKTLLKTRKLVLR
jgi:hypothetical protein